MREKSAMNESAVTHPPAWILNFLGDVVQIVPTIVRPQASVECCGDDPERRCWLVKSIRQMLSVSCLAMLILEPIMQPQTLESVTLKEFPGSAANNNQDSHQFCCRKDILNSHSQVNAITINKQDADCESKWRNQFKRAGSGCSKLTNS